MKLKPRKRAAVAVKICGITNSQDAKFATRHGADALGFNFYAKSPRRVGVAQARAIARKMPHRSAAVGVFVNTPVGEVLRIARKARLAAVQLHGDESPRMVAAIARHLPVIKALRVGPSFSVRQFEKYPAATAFLLDGFDDRLPGGTGKTFRWSVVRGSKHFAPVILAGGLNGQNVGQAIRAAAPYGVDVCSGVERLAGKKDAKNMREFLNAVEKRPRTSK